MGTGDNRGTEQAKKRIPNVFEGILFQSMEDRF